MKYRRLFEISIHHEYWNKTNPALFDFALSVESEEVARKFRLISKKRTNSITVLAEEGKIESLDEFARSSDHPFFTFFLLRRTSDIFNYTAIPQLRNDQVAHFQASGSPDVIDSIKILPLRSSFRGEAGEDDEIKGLDEKPIKVPSQFRDHLPDGYYTSGEKEFCFLKRRHPNLFGVISMNMASAGRTEDGKYTLDLKSRAVKLKYHVSNSRNVPTQIIDTSLKAKFEKIENSDSSYSTFLSSELIKLYEKPPNELQLTNGGEKPLIRHLPVGTTDNLKMDDQGQFLNEIYVHL